MEIESILGGMKFSFVHRWTAAVAAAIVGIGLFTAPPEQSQAAENLTIHYRDAHNNPQTMIVAKDVEYLSFNRPFIILLPEGLTKLHTLVIKNALYLNDAGGGRLRLPKDIGKDADWPFRLVIYDTPLNRLSIHEEMGRFEVIFYSFNFSDTSLHTVFFYPSTQIPPAKELIENMNPIIHSFSDDDNDGKYEGFFPVSVGESAGLASLSVYGIAPKISMTHIKLASSIRLSWSSFGTLQMAPTINGPWADVDPNPGGGRTIWFNTSDPADPARFFRFKPPPE